MTATVPVALTAVKLEHRVLHKQITLIQLHKDVLRNLGLLLRRRPSKLVKVNLHPFVALLVDWVVLVTQFLAGHTVRQGLGLRRGTVLIRATDVERVDVADTLV